ncbi:MAG: hypothetical protein IJ189_01955 [Clostridia bacterium]|nr:hypothetical protein [Clostridia bacterium]
MESRHSQRQARSDRGTETGSPVSIFMSRHSALNAALSSHSGDTSRYDFLERRESAQVGGPVRIRMHKAVRGFSSIAYMEDGIYAPKG